MWSRKMRGTELGCCVCVCLCEEGLDLRSEKEESNTAAAHHDERSDSNGR
jgi:hypothetical protein